VTGISYAARRTSTAVDHFFSIGRRRFTGRMRAAIVQKDQI
jgi:hypothetical protein